MPACFLLGRVLLHFGTASDDLQGELSAAAVTPDGSLWVGSDESILIERLSPIEPHIFGNHRPFAVGDFVPLFNQKDEIDVEGLDYADNYLWLTGSHSTKRKKVKGKDLAKDLQRLATVQTESNRYTLARIPVFNGELLKSFTPPDLPDQPRHAALLQTTDDKNVLIDALHDDPHLGPFLSFPLPAKENGFDIEGLAVQHNRVFLGLRGPVLRGWAMILEIEVAEQEPGVLTLHEIGAAGRLYKKHFVDLNGLGIRELCLNDDDLIILAGPTMDLEGAMRVFLLNDVLDLPEDSVTEQDGQRLEVLFDIPFTIGSDHAEGLALFPCLGRSDALLVVYDSPDPARRPEPHAVYADVFRLRP